MFTLFSPPPETYQDYLAVLICSASEYLFLRGFNLVVKLQVLTDLTLKIRLLEFRSLPVSHLHVFYNPFCLLTRLLPKKTTDQYAIPSSSHYGYDT